MTEENKLSTSDSEGSDVKPAEGDENVSKADDLEKAPENEAEYYKKLTGREDVQSKEDFEKHYDGMKSLVGDQAVVEMRKKAEAWDKSQKDTEKDVKEFTESKEGKETLKEFKGAGDVAELRGEIEEMKLLKEHPEAKDFLESVKAISDQTNVSLSEAYEKHLKELVTSKLETEKAKEEEQNISVDSKSRIAPLKSQKITQLAKKAAEGGSLVDKEELVKEVLGLSE